MKQVVFGSRKGLVRDDVFNVVFAATVFLFLTLLFPYIHTFPGDDSCWADWSTYMLQHGLPEAYGSKTNYMPLYQYVLWGYGNIAGSGAAIWEYLPYLRCFTLLFDFAGVWLLWEWLDKRGSYPILLACCLANLALSYDTIFWGQVDGIVSTLVFATMLAAWKRKVLVSGLCMVLAWNMKLQAGIFIPVWGILMLPSVVSRSSRRQLMMMVPAMIALQLVLIAPFAYGPGGWKGVWQVVTGSLHNVPALSVNAYNWWYWTTSEYPGNVPDAGIAFMGLTYKQIGLLAFFTLSAFALYPLAMAVYRNIQIKAHAFSEDDAKCIWLTSGLVCILFFFCNTEMHERYVHPAVLFLTAYAFRYKRYGMYAIFCVAYVLNLEGALHWLKLPNYGTVLFDGRVIAGLYAVVIVWLFVLLYQRKPLSAAQQAGSD